MQRTLLLLGALLGLTRATAQLTPPVVIVEDHFPYIALVPCDWDHDGDLDFVGAQLPTLALHWFENTGGGVLAGPVLLPDVYYYAAMPAMVDLNADGRTDLILPEVYPSHQKQVRLQTPDGQFGPPVLLWGYDSDFHGLEPADCDGDGDADLVRLDLGLRWYENDGTGHFPDPPHYLDDSVGHALHVADVDADGLSDIAVADGSAQLIRVLKNLGGGNFAPAVTVGSFTGTMHRLTGADLNGDDRIDLLPLYHDRTGQYWFPNTGGGAFAAEQPLDPAADWLNVVQDLHPADFDGDGDLDLLAQMSRDSILWYENGGNGAFSAHLLASWPVINYLYRVGAADFDADGLPELVATDRAIQLFPNLGGGELGPRQILRPEILDMSEVRRADLDQDGLDDVLAVSGGDGKLSWYPNLGGGQFGGQRLIAADNYFGKFVRTADIDGDGDTDVLSGIIRDIDVYEMFWYANDGAGQFATAAPLFANGLYLPVAAAEITDVDGDGKPDVVCHVKTPTSPLAWLRNDGTGVFGFPEFVATSAGSFAVVDLDADGDPDLVAFLDTGFHWYANDGAGNFGDPIPLNIQGELYYPVVAVDVDADGDLDLSDGERWSPGLGNQTFGPAQKLSFGGSGFADLNLDGKIDRVGGFYGALGWQPSLGEGLFGEWIFLRIRAGYNGGSATGSDMDGDGDQELLYFYGDEMGYVDNLRDVPFITGYCFHDENENGQRDEGERDLPGIQLTLNPGLRSSFPGADGRFRFYVEPGNYILSYRPDSCCALTTDSAAWHIAFSNATVGGRYFGFKPAAGRRKLEMQVMSGPVICDRKAPFWLTTQNAGCHPVWGKRTLVKDPSASFDAFDPAPDLISGDTLVWLIDTLHPGESRTTLGSILPVMTFAGDTLHFILWAETYGPDGVAVVSRDSAAYHPVVLCSYDPNDKLVSRHELEPDYQPDSSELVYTIRFQNTGNYYAFNITVRDTLPDELDWPTLRPLAASHAFFSNLDATAGIAEFHFPDILLLDSFTNEALSHGFVTFAVRPQAGLAPGSAIANRAGIYFDYNLPVLTPYIETTVKEVIALLPEPAEADGLRVFPNPTRGRAILVFREPPGPTLLRIYDLQGRLRVERDLHPDQTTAEIDVSPLAPGAYRLEAGGKRVTVVVME